MKENRHKAEDVLTRPRPGRQKERGDTEGMKTKRKRKTTKGGERRNADNHKEREGEKGQQSNLKRL